MAVSTAGEPATLTSTVTTSHPAKLELAAIAVGHHVGLEMADTWPTPRPPDQAGWIALIDGLLEDGGQTRSSAIESCERMIEANRAAYVKMRRDIIAGAVAEILNEDRLTKITRVEAHLGRELTRKITLLRTLQADRREREADS